MRLRWIYNPLPSGKTRPKDYLNRIYLHDWFINAAISLLTGRILQSCHRNAYIAMRYAEGAKDVLNIVGIFKFAFLINLYTYIIPIVDYVRRYIYRWEGIHLNSKIDKMLLRYECMLQILAQTYNIQHMLFEDVFEDIYVSEIYWTMNSWSIISTAWPSYVRPRLRSYMYILAYFLQIRCVFVGTREEIDKELEVIKKVQELVGYNDEYVVWLRNVNTNIGDAHVLRITRSNLGSTPYDPWTSYLACVTWEEYYKALEVGYIIMPVASIDKVELLFAGKTSIIKKCKSCYARYYPGVLSFLRQRKIIKDRRLYNPINVEHILQKIEPLKYIQHNRKRAYENIHKQAFLIKKKINGLLYSIENSTLSYTYNKIEHFLQNTYLNAYSTPLSHNTLKKNISIFFTKPLVRDSCNYLYDKDTCISNDKFFEYTKMLRNNKIIMLETKYDKYAYFSRYISQHYKKQTIYIIVESISTLKDIDSILSRKKLMWYSYEDLHIEKANIYILNVADYTKAYDKKMIRHNITIIGEYTPNINTLKLHPNAKGIFCKEDPFLSYPYTQIVGTEWKHNSDVISMIQTRLWSIENKKNFSIGRYYKHRKRYTDYAYAYYYLKLLESDMRYLPTDKMRYIIGSIHTLLIQKNQDITKSLRHIHNMKTESMDVINSYMMYILNHNIVNTLSTAYTNNKKDVLQSEYMTNRLFNSSLKNSFNTSLAIIFNHVIYTWVNKVIDNKVHFYKYNTYKKYLIPNIYYRDIVNNIQTIRKYFYTFF